MRLDMRIAIVLSIALVILMALFSHANHGNNTCDLQQPIYINQNVAGSWRAEINVGQSVVLPDGDTAICTTNGTVIK